MAAYKGQSRRIKDALKQILSEVTYDTGSGSEPAFQDVKGSTQGEFDGYPSARVLPGDVEDEKGAMGQNDHGPSYIVRLYVNREADSDLDEEALIDQMYDLTDLVIDELDRADYNDALKNKDPEIRDYIMTSSEGAWSVFESSAGT